MALSPAAEIISPARDPGRLARLGHDISNAWTPSQRSSTTTTPSRICRICHDGDRKDKLFSPCHCSGTMGLVHQKCLEMWLSSSAGSRCEVCNYSFILRREPQPLRRWFHSPSHPRDVKTLVGDVICFAMLTPLATLSCYLCFLGIIHFMNLNCRLEVAGLVILCCCLAMVYTAWTIITIRYHIRVWKEWKATHQSVKLLRLTKFQRCNSATDSNNDALHHYGFSDGDMTAEVEDSLSQVFRTEPDGEENSFFVCATQTTIVNGVETVEIIPRLGVSIVTIG